MVSWHFVDNIKSGDLKSGDLKSGEVRGRLLESHNTVYSSRSRGIWRLALVTGALISTVLQRKHEHEHEHEHDHEREPLYLDLDLDLDMINE